MPAIQKITSEFLTGEFGEKCGKCILAALLNGETPCGKATNAGITEETTLTTESSETTAPVEHHDSIQDGQS